MSKQEKTEIEVLEGDFMKQEPLVELLIRIDERVKNMDSRLERLESTLTSPSEYRDIVVKVNKLWDWRNKVIGSAAIAGSLASVIFEVAKEYFIK